MIALEAFKELREPFGWFLTLGKADTVRIKDEIQDLLQHSSQSLRSLLELTEIMRDIPRIEFYEGTFWPIANHCLWFFTSPAAAHRVTTDIQRDMGRITFKMAQLLRTEEGDWKGIGRAFRALRHARGSFLEQYEAELRRIGIELDAIGNLLAKSDRGAAHARYSALRASLMTSRQALVTEIAQMQKAEAHIRSLLS